MRELTNGTLVVNVFDHNVWLQERNYAIVTDTNASLVSLCFPNISTPIATYTLDSNHQVVIDLTDFIRVYGSQSNVYIRSDSGASVYVNIDYEVVGLINPESVIIPDHKANSFLISPPRMMFKGEENTPVVEVMAQRFDSPFIDEVRVDGVVVQRGALASVSISHDTFDIVDEIGHITTKLDTYTLRDQVCGHRYALVRWVSAFGSTKVFTWEIIESKVSVGDTISLIPMIDDYNTIKGREDSFSLFLDNLSAYDYWYYSDIITSSKVEVSLDGGTTFRQVDVTTKSVTIPDGDAGKMNDLNVSVKYRKYDAVAM